ncbi:MAG: MBL fold metallo-hydrolase, partial [Gemmatimonadaceae bacterium]
MALHVQKYGDVTRLRMSSAGGRATGYDVSTYIVRGVMVDTGFYHARHALVHAVDSLHVRGAIVTHWHEDHAGNAGLLAGRGLPILARPDTEAILRDRPHIRLYRRVIWGHQPAFASPLVAFDAGSLRTIHTPGHSLDHQVVLDEETGTLFSGDLWLGVHARTLHASEDPYQIIESLQIVRALAPDRMFDAHRGFVERPVHSITAKIEWLGETLQTVERRVAAGDGDRAIVREVLGGEELAATVSFGDYSRENLVKALRADVQTMRGWWR